MHDLGFYHYLVNEGNLRGKYQIFVILQLFRELILVHLNRTRAMLQRILNFSIFFNLKHE